MYVNLCQPLLLALGGAAHCFGSVRAKLVPSLAMMAPLTKDLVAAIEGLARDRGIEPVVFAPGDRIPHTGRSRVTEAVQPPQPAASSANSPGCCSRLCRWSSKTPLLTPRRCTRPLRAATARSVASARVTRSPHEVDEIVDVRLSFRVRCQADCQGKVVTRSRGGGFFPLGRLGAGGWAAAVSRGGLQLAGGRLGLPGAVLAQEGVEQAGEPAHDSDEGDLVLLAGGGEALVAGLGGRFAADRGQGGHVEQLAGLGAAAADAAATAVLSGVAVEGGDAEERSGLAAAEGAELGHGSAAAGR